MSICFCLLFPSCHTLSDIIYRIRSCSKLLICVFSGMVILVIMLTMLIVTPVYLQHRVNTHVTSTGMI